MITDLIYAWVGLTGRRRLFFFFIFQPLLVVLLEPTVCSGFIASGRGRVLFFFCLRLWRRLRSVRVSDEAIRTVDTFKLGDALVGRVEVWFEVQLLFLFARLTAHSLLRGYFVVYLLLIQLNPF